MRIQNFMLFALISIGVTSFANAACPTTIAEAFRYADISACRACYLGAPLSGGSNNKVAADTYCLTKMSSYTTPQQICVQKMMADREEPILSQAERDTYVTQITAPGQACATATATATITTVTPVATATTTTSGSTVQQAQYAAAVAAQQRAAAAAAAAAAARTGTTGGSTNSGGSGLNAGDAIKLYQAIAGNNKGGNTEGGSGSPESTSTPYGGGPAVTTTAQTNPVTPPTTPVTTSIPNPPPPFDPDLPGNPDYVAPAGGSTADLPADAPVQAAGHEAQHAQEATANATIPKTGLTADAEAANAPLTALQTELDAAPPPAAGACAPALTIYKTVSGTLKTYLTEKQACTKSAEKAEFLCFEGTSPGAKAANVLINVAGPAIAVLSSAQKSCSGTSKMASLASGALLVAKTACVGAKLFCDSSCAAANKSLVLMNTQTTELAAATSACAAAPTPNPLAPADAAAKPIVAALTPKVTAALSGESVPATKGTTPAFQAKCASKALDIAGMGINILTLLTAKKSADKCSEQLAATGAASSSDVSTLKYCEAAANATSTFCKCQADNNAEGCPGNIASNASGDTTSKDVAGLSLRNGEGVSGFASGANAKGVNPVTGVAGLNNGSGSNSSGDLTGSGGVGGGASLGGLAGFGGGGNSASAGTNPDGTRKLPTAVKAEDAKKWDFGSVASALFGGGKSGKNSDVAGEVKGAAAVERRIASERAAGEVTSASGRSNWEKIRRSYLIKESSFDQ